MTTLTKECVKHTPHLEAVSFYQENFMDFEVTFCEECEQNIQRVDYDGYKWSGWHLTK